MCIEGPNTHFPLHALSKRQDSTATSAPTAEIISASTVVRTILVLAIDRWAILLERPGSMGILREDNVAAIRAMTSGRRPTMGHLHRVHAVSISSRHEIVGEAQKALVTLKYCPTDQMRADIYTKPFTSGPTCHHALSLIGVVPDSMP